MKPSAYIETSIVGHLASRLSRDLLTAAHQQLTEQWWDTRRQEFDLYVSELVVHEAGGGEPAEAQRRLACLEEISQLELNDACRRLARALVDRHAIPQEAVEDAIHIAIDLHPRGTLGRTLMGDPIVEEIRRIRHEHAARFNFDLDAIFEDLKEKERNSKRKVVSRPPRPARNVRPASRVDRR